jgi:hypothetical protein
MSYENSSILGGGRDLAARGGGAVKMGMVRCTVKLSNRGYCVFLQHFPKGKARTT